MTGTQHPLDGPTLDGPTREDHALDGRPSGWRDIRLNPRTHGRSRVPGHQLRDFDLDTFARALGDRDLDQQVARYAPGAEVCVVDPAHPPAAPRTLRGSTAVWGWLAECSVDALDPEVTHLVDGGDRVAFTQRWHRHDGTGVIATSTAEIEDGLIIAQHTVVAWDQA